VQDIYRFDARRIVAGLVEPATCPSAIRSNFIPAETQHREIHRDLARFGTTGAVTGPISAGSSIAITLTDELFVERGQIGAPPTDAPVEARVFTARVFWLHAEPCALATRSAPSRHAAAEARLVGSTARSTPSRSKAARPASEVKRHEVAEIRLRVRRPLAFDAGGRIPALGRFVLMRGRRIAGGA